MERRQDPERMAELLARGARHGWSWAELSRRTGLPAWKLRWWQRRLTRRRPVRRSGRAFIPVKVVAPRPGGGASFEVITPSGFRILIPGDFSDERLQRVLRALEPTC